MAAAAVCLVNVLTWNSRKRRCTMLGESIARRDGLNLSLNRSLSAPFGAHWDHPSVVASAPVTVPAVVVSAAADKESKRQRRDVVSAPTLQRDLLLPEVHAHHQFHTSLSASVSLPASPCNDNCSFARTLLLQGARSVSVDCLASSLQTMGDCSVLVVDCRPFVAFNAGHVRGAINVNCCDRFNRKRLLQGRATLADLASTANGGKERIRNAVCRGGGAAAEVVVYDESSENVDSLGTNDAIFLIMSALVEDGRQPVLLHGGMNAFQKSHPSLCEDFLMTTSSSSSPTQCHRVVVDVETFPVSQVLPGLFLGNIRDATTASVLEAAGVTHVLSVTESPPEPRIPHLSYKHLRASDCSTQDLSQYFEDAVDFMARGRAAGGVLVHCLAGISRSPTLVMAYLMQREGLTMTEAYRLLKGRRHIVSPNLGFMGQLLEFERHLSTGDGVGRH